MCKFFLMLVFFWMCVSAQAIRFEFFLSPNQRTFLEFAQSPVQSGCDSVMTLSVMANSSVHFRCPTENVNQWVTDSLVMYTHDVGCYLDTLNTQMVVLDWNVEPGNCIFACRSNPDCVSWIIVGLIFAGLFGLGVLICVKEWLCRRCQDYLNRRNRAAGPRFYDSRSVNYDSTASVNLAYQPLGAPVVEGV